MAKRKTSSELRSKKKRKTVKARKTSPVSAAATDPEQLYQTLKRYIRTRGRDYLRDRNITSIGISQKNGGGPLCLRFTVAQKGEQAIRTRDSYRIPKIIEIDGLKVPTDVVERTYALDFERVEPGTVNESRRRADPIQPGLSVSHIGINSGTIGLIVFDRATGAPCILSNWHVLQGINGQNGDDIIQPGKSDFGGSPDTVCAKLLRGFANEIGDGALARLLTKDDDPQARSFSREIFGLGVTPEGIVEVRLNDRIIKYGRTTGITRGIVTALHIQASLEVGDPNGLRSVTCFEISPDPAVPLPLGISMGGDSGGACMIFQDGAATGLFAGLHFSGNINLSGEKTALACYAHSLQTKLDFLIDPPA